MAIHPASPVVNNDNQINHVATPVHVVLEVAACPHSDLRILTDYKLVQAVRASLEAHRRDRGHRPILERLTVELMRRQSIRPRRQERLGFSPILARAGFPIPQQRPAAS